MMPADDTPERIEVTIPPSPKEFWVLIAHAMDWNVLLHRMILSVDPSHGKEPLDQKIAFIGFDGPQAIPVYYLSREHFPAEMIARLIGKPVGALDGIETLHLREIKGADGEPAQKAWQTPSVDYWGMG